MAKDVWARMDQDGMADPPEIDTTVAHSARMYDYWLGGKTNFAPDRALGDAVEQLIPTIRTMAQENRRFLGRAVRHLVREQGIRQFLDIGTGIPTEGNTHEVAQLADPTARVVYVDNDPIVLAHARALMDSSPAGRTAYLHADLREPEAILSHPALRQTLDLTRPVALMLISVLMLVADADDPWKHVATLLDALPAGSCVAVSHVTADFDPAAVGAVVDAEDEGRMTLVPRGRAEVARFFGDWELLEPGLSPVLAWRPDGAAPARPEAAYYWAGVARKRG
ncbi:SAM-dependent methyltransferase [Kitasatospora sp. NBC_01287]|uniref:SAM-dependent methyltransferase n=1 Tax=Kitasatospora sp. NBC_01287 TaxID=2903573 RepID=UPI0022501F4B|nr:SAM-dependent methyltransferase [Kitasatospora sp. NBC_01287]MCX4750257.1 SAM-dependent methyltransferase [Kitasatospora sp. NBC_01287]